jgi:hypothetical protein
VQCGFPGPETDVVALGQKILGLVDEDRFDSGSVEGQWWEIGVDL